MLFSRQVLGEHVAKLFNGAGLGEVIVHASLETELVITCQRICSESDNGMRGA